MKTKLLLPILFLVFIFRFFPQEFTVAVIPDSQYYTYYYYQNRLWNKFPENLETLFYKQIEYIKENSVTNNGDIVFAIHLGDIVDHESTFMEEWLMAEKGMSILDNVIPFGIVPGNHDYDKIFNSWNKDYNHKNRGLLFNDFFGPESHHFRNKEWYLDSFDDGMNQCICFDVEGKKFLFFGLELEPSDYTLFWVQKLLDENKKIPTIIAIHTYLQLDGTLNDVRYRNESYGNDSSALWEKLISCNDQIIFIVCGHICDENNGECLRIQENKYGNNVYAMLSDYQSRNEWFDRNSVDGNKGALGDGWLRLLHFNIEQNEVVVKTYSTEFNEYETDENSEFSLYIDFHERFGY